jgi:lysophospholipase L1-like esterase
VNISGFPINRHNTMKKILIISLAFNLLLILIGGYVILKKGGITYLRMVIAPQNQGQYNNYYYLKKSVFEMMPNDTNEIIFLGNSLTDCVEWHELFGKPNIKNRGISMDIIQGVIDRLDEIVESHPSKIFLMIGTNDLGQVKSVDEILVEYERLVNLILESTPETELYLQSILPKRNSLRSSKDIMKFNEGISEISKKYSLTYINLFELFRDSNNELKEELSHDGIHINGKGYLLWKEAVIDYVGN